MSDPVASGLRRALDSIYLGSGVLSGICLVGIAVTIVAQVVGRELGYVVDSTETAGFCLAASTFFGLAYAFRGGAHVRVTLLIRYAGPLPRKLVELWCVGFAVVAMGYFLYWAGDLVYFSWKFKELSPGLLAIPFWIPRLAMALGSAVFLVALIDEFVAILRGAEPSYEANAETALGDLPEAGE
ncbi:MAG: TRAP transporter small permease [Pseudomonadota bacterium]|nr:TRAP transporter small permease [Pseudomonadota bacterium]MEE3101266.1 TRAP transporter small permease [Pseudomonadota bacterium]